MESHAERDDGRRRRPLRLVLVAILVAAAVVLALTRPEAFLDMRRWIERVGPWAPLLYILLQGSRGVTWLPGGILSPLGGLLFGLGWGLVYTWIGLLIAAALGFLLTRTLRETEPTGRVARTFDRLRERTGGREGLAVFLARLVPGIPYNVVSYLAGASSISWPAYLLASALGLFPRMAIQVAIGAGVFAVGQHAA